MWWAAWWTLWWVWIGGGLLIAVLELLLPGYIFIGFATGAILTGIALGLELPGSGWIGASPGNALLTFALLSVVTWLVLRRLVGVRRGQVRIWTRDINED